MPNTSKPKDVLEDRALVRLVQSGERDAFEILVRRHQSRILNLCFRLLGEPQSAKELAGDIFAEAFRSLGSFRGHSEFGTWLYRLGLNQVYSHIKRASRKRSLEGPLETPDGEEAGDTHAAHPLESIELNEKRVQIRRVLGTLSKDHAEILILHDVEGLSYEAVSELAQLPIGTVMSRLSRAREAFRKRWNEFA